MTSTEKTTTTAAPGHANDLVAYVADPPRPYTFLEGDVIMVMDD
jgi:hypothetical protein